MRSDQVTEMAQASFKYCKASLVARLKQRHWQLQRQFVRGLIGEPRKGSLAVSCRAPRVRIRPTGADGQMDLRPSRFSGEVAGVYGSRLLLLLLPRRRRHRIRAALSPANTPPGTQHVTRQQPDVPIGSGDPP